jgi:hypothetical protein
MTTNKSSLDDHKLEYELTGGDPKKKKAPKAIQMSTMRVSINKAAFKRRPKRHGIIRTYFECLTEVMLA